MLEAVLFCRWYNGLKIGDRTSWHRRSYGHWCSRSEGAFCPALCEFYQSAAKGKSSLIWHPESKMRLGSRKLLTSQLWFGFQALKAHRNKGLCILVCAMKFFRDA